MSNLYAKFLAMAVGSLFLFTNFISCGAQLYKVSLEGDHDDSKISANSLDPHSAFFGIHASEGWNELPIRFKVGHKMTLDQQDGLTKAMKTWEMAVGKTLFEFEGFDENYGDSFKDLYSSLDDPINGHYLDSDWKKTGKSQMVLATTIWDNHAGNTHKITTADIRFNDQFYFISNSFNTMTSQKESREVVDMESLALHELGHFLGLTHVSEEVDPYSVMNPALFIGEGLANRHLSKGDIERIHKIYNCQGDACNPEVVITQIADLKAQEANDDELKDKVTSQAEKLGSVTPHQEP